MKTANRIFVLYCLMLLVLPAQILLADGEPVSWHTCPIWGFAFEQLGLTEEATDEEIVEKLDHVNKIVAMGLVWRRNITSAVPKLAEIAEDKNEHVLNRATAAEALNSFGHREWVPVLIELAEQEFAQPHDPNDLSFMYSKLRLAGTLAMGEEYSYLGFVLESMEHDQRVIRNTAAAQLREYVHLSNPVSDIASDALLHYAINDPNSIVRQSCIYSLEKMQQKRPDYKNKFLVALTKNSESKNEDLRTLSNDKLNYYQRYSPPDNLGNNEDGSKR